MRYPLERLRLHDRPRKDGDVVIADGAKACTRG
jgi:hypothetical protein